jgi:hypothetical protein
MLQVDMWEYLIGSSFFGGSAGFVAALICIQSGQRGTGRLLLTQQACACATPLTRKQRLSSCQQA